MLHASCASIFFLIVNFLKTTRPIIINFRLKHLWDKWNKIAKVDLAFQKFVANHLVFFLSTVKTNYKFTKEAKITIRVCLPTVSVN